MADKKISQLTGATTPLAGTEVLPIVQGGSTVKVSVANLTAGRAVSADSASLTQRLQIGSSDTTYAIEVGNTAAGSSGNLFRFIRSTTEFGAYISAGVPFFGTLTSNDFNLITNSTSRARIFASGGISVGDTTDPGAGNLRVGNGNLVVGTAAKGIDFSANTGAAGETSALLNWYEEGTWTPTYEGSTGSAGAVAYSEQAGSYTRIGNQVILRGTVILTNNGDWTGDVRIGGIPFNGSIASGSEAMGSVQMRNVTTAGAYVVADLGRTSTSKIAFINVNSAGAATAVACADVPDNGAFLFTIVYRVA